MHLRTRLVERIRGLLGRQPPVFEVRRGSSFSPDRPGSVDDLTVFVTTIGDRANFSDCMAHLKTQTVKAVIDVIDHVAPLSAALQEMHKRCRTDFYVQVDEDMLLAPDALETLLRGMRAAAPDAAMICAPLWDCDAERPIYGLKIYRTATVRRFPYEDTLSCEVVQLAQMEKAGYRIILQPLTDRNACLGEHGKHYTPETIFKRWQRCFQKNQRYPHMAWIEPYAQTLLNRYVASGNTVHLYAFLGAVAGMVGPPAADAELDWRAPNPALERLRHYFPPDR